ncbi:hypothetical protein NLS1_23100 [Nocardioides sp. LS1]|nr:hypothetical protein NLS1_23100 [Nocardioides sp. LS1]
MPTFAEMSPPGWVCATLGEQKVNERCPMMNTQMTAGLVQTWVSVVDARGREHLEARWVSPAPQAPAQTHVHAA